MAEGMGKSFCDEAVVSWPPFSRPERIKLTLSWGALQGPHPLLPPSPWEPSGPPPVLPHEVMLPLQIALQV